MKKLNKLLIAAVAVIAGIALGALLVSQTGSEYIDEQEVRAMITDRYGGEIENISQSDDERFYIVSMKNEEYKYEIKVSRDDSSIENIVTEKITQQNEDTAAKKEEGKSSDKTTEEESKEEKKDPEADEKSKEEEASEKQGQEEKEAENTLITEEEAKQIALNEVGGTFVHLTLNQETHPKQYQIIQRVDDDDEGALVTVDAIDGDALKVLWFQIDFNNIADIEAFAQQLQDYNTQYQNNYYMEFDDNNDDNDNSDEDDADDYENENDDQDDDNDDD